MELLLSLLIFIVVIGIVYWVAAQFLPHPFPTLVLVVGVIVLLFWLLGNADGVDLDAGDRR
jgi:hypothetical protein